MVAKLIPITAIGIENDRNFRTFLTFLDSGFRPNDGVGTRV